MPAWYTGSAWVLGELASEDDGSLRPAAMVELYLCGRNDFAHGLIANSPARSFAEAAEAAVARVHADHTGNANAFLAMPEAVRVAKFWEHIAGCASGPSSSICGVVAPMACSQTRMTYLSTLRAGARAQPRSAFY